MSIPYNPQPSRSRFFVPKTLASDFDRFLENDIPNTVMDFVLLKNWYAQFEEDYEVITIRGEIYPDSTKSRYENTDHFMNFRTSLTSGIKKGDMIINPTGDIYVLDWEVEEQSNNAPSRALRCNMKISVTRNGGDVTDDMGYLIEEAGEHIIVDSLPCNAYRYDGRPEYSSVSGNPGTIPNALTILTCQFNEQTKNIRIDDKFIWGNDTYIIVDINLNGMNLDGTYGTLKLQTRKAPGGMIDG